MNEIFSPTAPIESKLSLLLFELYRKPAPVNFAENLHARFVRERRKRMRRIAGAIAGLCFFTAIPVIWFSILYFKPLVIYLASLFGAVSTFIDVTERMWMSLPLAGILTMTFLWALVFVFATMLGRISKRAGGFEINHPAARTR